LQAVSEDARAYARRRDESFPTPSRLHLALRVLQLAWTADHFLAVLIYRARTALQRHGIPVFPRLLHLLNGALFGVRIGDKVVIDGGLYVPHGHVVIDGIVRIGKNCALFPFSTIGLTAANAIGPTLGDRVVVGSGARILGAITVGDRARIGANAVVLDDVPAERTAIGVPAEVLDPTRERQLRGSETEP